MKRVITIRLEGPDNDALNIAQAKAWKQLTGESSEKQDANSRFEFTVDQLDEPDPEEARYRSYAQGYLQRDGDLEFDDNAVVSMGDDPGAYVQGWKWVDKCDLPGEDDEADD